MVSLSAREEEMVEESRAEMEVRTAEESLADTRCFSRREIPCLSSRVDVAQGAEQGQSGVADTPVQAGRPGGPLGRRAGDARRQQ